MKKVDYHALAVKRGKIWSKKVMEEVLEKAFGPLIDEMIDEYMTEVWKEWLKMQPNKPIAKWELDRIVELRDKEGLLFQYIAERLGRNEKTVSQAYNREKKRRLNAKD